VTLVTLLLAPAVPAVLGGVITRNALPVFNVDEKAAVCDGLRAVPPDARVATAQTFNHPVALCGRAIVAGYGGHLWTHGIEAGAVEQRLRLLMMGWPGWSRNAHELGATHVFWGPREEREFPGSARLWERDQELLWRGPWGALYGLSPVTSGQALLRSRTRPSASRTMNPPTAVDALGTSPKIR
jgi:hypothetical protein